MLCGSLVLARSFYVFPTGFAYHCDCLVAEVRRTAGPRKQEEIDALLSNVVEARRRLEADVRAETEARRRAADDGELGAAPARRSESEALLRTLQAQIDDLIGAEDPMLGDAMIDAVVKPLEPPRTAVRRAAPPPPPAPTGLFAGAVHSSAVTVVATTTTGEDWSV